MKPVVKYHAVGYPIKEGFSAVVMALDHPRLGNQVVTTSTVLKMTPEGFETLNTVYEFVSDH